MTDFGLLANGIPGELYDSDIPSIPPIQKPSSIRCRDIGSIVLRRVSGG